MQDQTLDNNKIDRLWFLALLLAGTVLSSTLAATVFELTVLLSGILCVGLIAIGRREGYLIGLYSSLSYALIAHSNGLFGEVYLNLLFFVPTGIIGFFMWQRHTSQDKAVVMRGLSWPIRIIIALVCLTGVVGLGWLLGLNPNQNAPFVDATTNVLSVVATFLMMWRYKEQWLLYILLNVVSIVMWALRGIGGGESGDMMVLMWSLFLLNAIFGYWRWHRGAEQNSLYIKAVNSGEALCDAA